MNIERQMEINSDRRERANDRWLDKMNEKSDAAEALIGELNCQDKRFYVNGLDRKGNMNGKVYKFTYRSEAIDFLIRNHYV